MGCFDVGCAISRIGIKYNEPAFFLFLIPTTSYPHSFANMERDVKIAPGTALSYGGPTGLYQPFCLPIRGIYNDYGALENVVRCATVEFLEKRYGCELSSIFEIVHRNEYMTPHSKEIFALYGMSGVSLDGDITSDWLLSVGFVSTDKNRFMECDTEVYEEYQHPDSKFAYVSKQGDEFYIHRRDKLQDENSFKKLQVRTDRKDFCEQFYRESSFALSEGVLLGINPDKTQEAKELTKLSGCFIDAELYDALTDDWNDGDCLDSYMNHFMLDIMGFEFVATFDRDNKELVDEGYPLTFREEGKMVYRHPASPDFLFTVSNTHSKCVEMYKSKDIPLNEKHKIPHYKKGKSYHPFSIRGFAEMFESETGHALDISKISSVKSIDIFLRRCADVIVRRRNLAEKVNNDKEGSSKEFIRFFMRLTEGLNDSEKDVVGALGWMPFFNGMYGDGIISNDTVIREQIARFKKLVRHMWSANILFIPSVSHGQHCDYQNQFNFYEIVRNVAEKKYQKYKEEYDEEE